MMHAYIIVQTTRSSQRRRTCCCWHLPDKGRLPKWKWVGRGCGGLYKKQVYNMHVPFTIPYPLSLLHHHNHARTLCTHEPSAGCLGKLVDATFSFCGFPTIAFCSIIYSSSQSKPSGVSAVRPIVISVSLAQSLAVLAAGICYSRANASVNNNFCCCCCWVTRSFYDTIISGYESEPTRPPRV